MSSLKFSDSSPGQRIPPTCPPGFQGRYTVQPGDTLYSIAQTFGVALSSLVRANPQISSPDSAFPGDVLCVPGAPPIEVPCAVVLYPIAPGLPVGALGVALIDVPITGQGHTAILAHRLPNPNSFGDFNAYAGQLFFSSPANGGPGFILATVPTQPGEPAVLAGTERFPFPPGVPLLTETAEVFVQPINTMTGATGPQVLGNTLADCF